MASDGYSHQQIKEALAISHKTYYRWLELAYEYDLQVMFEEENQQEVRRQVIVIKDRLQESYKVCKEIAKDKSIDAEARLQAIQACSEISSMIMQIHLEGPMTVAKNAARVLEKMQKKPLLQH